MKLYEIKDREISKENDPNRGEYSSVTYENYLKSTRRLFESKKGIDYEVGLKHYQRLVKEYQEKKDEYKNEYKKKYEYSSERNWNVSRSHQLNYGTMMAEILSLLSSERFSDRVGIVFIHTGNEQFKAYMSFLDKNNKIIVGASEKWGKKILVNKIESDLKNAILKTRLLLVFDIRGEKICFNESDSIQETGKSETYQQHDDEYKSLRASFQVIALTSGIIASILMTIASHSNGIISKWQILGVGLGFPFIGISLLDLLQDRRLVFPESLKYAGITSIISGFIILLLTFFSQLIPFPKFINITLNALWPIAAGIWMVKVSSEKIPEKIISPESDQLCDKCFGRGIFIQESVTFCSKCSGTGLLGEHIDQHLKIKDIVSKRRPVIIFALLYPVVLSLLFVLFR